MKNFIINKRKNKTSRIFLVLISTIVILNFLSVSTYGETNMKELDSIPTWSVLETKEIYNNTINSRSNNIIETSGEVAQNNELTENELTEKNNTLNLTSGGAVLIEQNSGTVLYDYKMHEKLRPASVTKVMSLLLIMEALDSNQISLNDKVPCTEDAAKMGGSQIWLDEREELTVDEMIKAICVVSANDCTVAMADYIAGTQDAFVEKMNAKAKELGMNDTIFKNCHGIDEDGHLTSAYDIALMSRELLTKHPRIMDYTTIYMDSLRDGKSQLVNTNKLIRNYSGATGLKTGSTSEALFNLSASATRNDLSLIAVIMRGETSKIRFSEASKLLNYGFSNFEYKKLATKGAEVGMCKVSKGIKTETPACYESDFGVVLNKKNSKNITESIEIYKNISAPIIAGSKVGEVTYKNEEGNIIGKVNLASEEDVEKYGFGTMSKKIYTNWVSLLRV